MMRERLLADLQNAVEKGQKEGVFPRDVEPEVQLEIPRDPRFGDYCSNVAMTWAPRAGLEPREVAREIVLRLSTPAELVRDVRVEGPGFINIFVTPQALHEVLREVLRQGPDYGRRPPGQGRAVLEYVWSRPAAPLHPGQGRRAVLGDCLARLLEHAGYRVERQLRCEEPGPGREAALEHLRLVLERARVGFDRFLCGDPAAAGGKARQAIEGLQARHATYAGVEGLWFAATRFGEPQDELLAGPEGQPTAFALDLGNLWDKIRSGFDLCIDLWGDRPGQPGRLQAALQALGSEGRRLQVIAGQEVQFLGGAPEAEVDGRLQKVSRRTGRPYTFLDLLEELGVDTVRYFFLLRSGGSVLEFDLDLAAEPSDANPACCIQYAHARISSLRRMASDQGVGLPEDPGAIPLGELTRPPEIELVRCLEQFPWVTEMAAQRREPHHVPHYALTLAGLFHSFYNQHRILGEAPETTQARLALCLGVQTVLANCCRLMGLEAPERL
jgi:arginyl-tRNA synthetase